jgi:hypothetical protein
VDMVSNQGPLFLSQFWKAFCTLIGSSASLSSRFPWPAGASQLGPVDDSSLPDLCQFHHLELQLVWVEYATPSLAQPLASRLLSTPWDFRPTLQRKKKRSAYPRPRYLSDAVAVPGREPGRLFSRPPPGIDDRQTASGPRLLIIISGRGYGCPANCTPILSFLSPSQSSLAPLLFIFCCPVNSVYIPFSCV